MTPQTRAERSAAVLWATDMASQTLGLSLEAIGPGTAKMTLTVQEQHLNGHKTCHGGILFSLADSCFAFACNSYNQRTVAQDNSITYLSPAHLGETLTAHAVEAARSGRSGVYDVAVINASGHTVALFRGLSRTLSGTLFEDPQ